MKKKSKLGNATLNWCQSESVLRESRVVLSSERDKFAVCLLRASDCGGVRTTMVPVHPTGVE